MLLAQIEAFVEVARHRNVTRAAAALGVSQPALTARLRGLERELGLALVARAAHGVRLTDAARAFLPYAERMLASVAEGRAAMGELRRGTGGVLQIGAAPAVGTYVLPPALKRFRASHPDVRLVVRTGHSEEVLELVLGGDVQLGIMRELRHPDVESILLYEDHLVLVAEPGHRLASRPEARMEDLREDELVLFDRASSYHDLTFALFREAGVTPRSVMQLDNIDAAKKMVEQGLGVALLPRTAIAEELARGSLRAIRLRDAPRVRRRIIAIRRRGSGPPAPPVAAFIEVLRAMGREGEIPAYSPAAARSARAPAAAGASGRGAPATGRRAARR